MSLHEDQSLHFCLDSLHSQPSSRQSTSHLPFVAVRRSALSPACTAWAKKGGVNEVQTSSSSVAAGLKRSMPVSEIVLGSNSTSKR